VTFLLAAWGSWTPAAFELPCAGGSDPDGVTGGKRPAVHVVPRAYTQRPTPNCHRLRSFTSRSWRHAVAGLAVATTLVAFPHESQAADRHIGRSALPTPHGLLALGHSRIRPNARVVDTSAEDFAVSPLVSPEVRKFVRSEDDLKRSSLLGRVVVPLVLLLLIEAELLAAGGRAEARLIRAFSLPLIALFAMLVLVRLRAYAG
jgi:hypothetical protein